MIGNHSEEASSLFSFETVRMMMMPVRDDFFQLEQHTSIASHALFVERLNVLPELSDEPFNNHSGQCSSLEREPQMPPPPLSLSVRGPGRSTTPLHSVACFRRWVHPMVASDIGAVPVYGSLLLIASFTGLSGVFPNFVTKPMSSWWYSNLYFLTSYRKQRNRQSVNERSSVESRR